MAKEPTKTTAIEKMKEFNEDPNNTGGITGEGKKRLEVACKEE